MSETEMSVEQISFRGRVATRLSNQEISLTVTRGGGHIAELKLAGEEHPNLLWQPGWETMEPDEFDERVHSAHSGGGSEARLLSSILGHNLCFPFWGNPTPAEYAAGATFHGETNVVSWQCKIIDECALVLSASLPESQMRMRREIRLDGNHVQVQTVAENLSAWDKPVAWCEHVTFGPPFLSSPVTLFEASLGEGFVTGKEDEEHFCWPEGKGDARADLSRFGIATQHDLVNSFLVKRGAEPAFFRATNAAMGIAVEYRFSVHEFPWLNVWENNDGRMQTRAMEFSNTPRHGTMKTLIQSAKVLNTPVYDWVDARGSLRKSFRISVRRL